MTKKAKSATLHVVEHDFMDGSVLMGKNRAKMKHGSL
jgi:hypothetical protein